MECLSESQKQQFIQMVFVSIIRVQVVPVKNGFQHILEGQEIMSSLLYFNMCKIHLGVI